MVVATERAGVNGSLCQRCRVRHAVRGSLKPLRAAGRGGSSRCHRSCELIEDIENILGRAWCLERLGRVAATQRGFASHALRCCRNQNICSGQGTSFVSRRNGAIASGSNPAHRKRWTHCPGRLVGAARSLPDWKDGALTCGLHRWRSVGWSAGVGATEVLEVRGRRRLLSRRWRRWRGLLGGASSVS